LGKAGLGLWIACSQFLVEGIPRSETTLFGSFSGKRTKQQAIGFVGATPLARLRLIWFEGDKRATATVEEGEQKGQVTNWFV
jgi:hypothetical protein